MSTRKIKDAVDLSTGEKVYYKGHAKATFMSDGRTVEDAIKTAGGGGAIPVIDHGTEDTTFTLTPNKFHIWGEVDSLTLSFGEAQSGVMNEYLFQFSSGTNATALSLPEGVEWENGAYPEILANATHQVSIVNGLASIAHYYTRKYLTIEAIDAITVAFPAAVEYRIDGGKWTEAAASESVTASAGSRIQYRANLTPDSTSGIGTFSISGRCNLSGNCMSLLFGDDAIHHFDLTEYQYAFYKLFLSCNSIIAVSSDFLPATKVSAVCYHSMFHSCSALTTAPTLPATTLANSCYAAMFQSCTSLVNAPTLPATALAEGCYYSTFEGCTSLVVAPTLPAVTLISQCYIRTFYGCSKLNNIKALFTTAPSASFTQNWVSGVASSGTFTKNKNATWTTTGANGIPSGWTVKTE